MNKQAAKEWLTKSWHNLSTAILLYKAEHYTDIIAVEIHYSCEKTLKTILAYSNKKIPKTHSLIEISKEISLNIDLTDDLELLKQISRYHIEESYPAFDRALPPREEIREVLDFAKEIVYKANLNCKINPIETKDYVALAKRPHYSVLNKTKIKNKFNIDIPYWKDSLSECLITLGEKNEKIIFLTVTENRNNLFTLV